MLRHRFLLVFIVELVYWIAARRLAYEFRDSPMKSELVRAALRIASLSADFALARSLILSRASNTPALRHRALYPGLLLFLLVPVLTGHAGMPTQKAWLFVATSLFAGIKEEFLFRGIVQNLFSRRLGAAASVLVTSIYFALWHIGLVPPTFSVLSDIFLASVLLGLVYLYSGSIAAVVVLHATYDALFALTPLVPTPLAGAWASVLLIGAVGAVAFWARRAPAAAPRFART